MVLVPLGQEYLGIVVQVVFKKKMLYPYHLKIFKLNKKNI